MADSEVTILIRAVDEVSATTKDIQSSVNGMAAETQKSSKAMTMSFQQSASTLIALGNAAGAVDSLFDSYSNMQLRVENASIRVEEAQKNLKESQYALNQVLSDGTSTAEDIAKAQDDVATASNRVTIAQNGLSRANNSVIGTYINMGVQTITLLASMPQLIASTITLTTAMWAKVPALYANAAGFLAITVAGAPLWIIILAIIAAVAAAIIIFKNWGVIVETLGNYFTWLKDTILMPVWNFMKDMYNWIKDKFLNVVDSVVNVAKKFSGSTPPSTKVLGGRATGGPINETGLYQLHAGEYVIPKNQTGGITYNINLENNNIYGTDPDQIAMALQEKLQTMMSI